MAFPSLASIVAAPTLVSMNSQHTPLDRSAARARLVIVPGLHGSVAAPLAALGSGPHVLVAHSFGCLAAVRAAGLHPSLDIAQMLLVAPAEPNRFDAATALPQSRLATRSCVVASDNDPWMSASQAHAWALRWGSDWINLGNAGHINVDSGYGPFPLAREWAAGALNRIDTRPWRAAA
jgi:predicted alpha/beta hydrolase family esterase